MKKIYLGCALSFAPLEYRQFISQIREKLEEKYEILKFYSDPLDLQLDQRSTEICQAIYNWDKNCVETCDFFVAFNDYPSTGLGMELAFAVTNQKPILLLCKDLQTCGRIQMGITGTRFEISEYSDVDSVTEFVDNFINKDVL